MHKPHRLYTTSDIAQLLGVRRSWVHNKIVKNADSAPMPEFDVKTNGPAPLLLWTESGLRRWEAYYASLGSIPPRISRHSAYSDHRAINRVGQLTVSWKLWWRCCFDGGTVWWFSTPQGWWVSENDGRDWRNAEAMIRPTDYRYHCVSSNAPPTPAIAAVLRSATRLRQRLERDMGVDIPTDNR